ncbi:MAG: Dabb family protein [Rhodobacteraceae bacterium]|nr:Dabb family protein [Paracoccaceae bacterium]
MIKHCVFAQINAETPQDEIDRVLSGFGTLVGEVEGMVDYFYGPNRDYENISPDYPYGFVATFQDRQALARYDEHPAHREFGAALVNMTVGGADGVVVFDIDV